MDDTDIGLAFTPYGDGEPEPGFIRESAKALEPLPLDLGNRAAFAPEPKVDLDGIGERLRPGDGGLQIGTDDDRLREDLLKLKEHEADLKLRALLDKAERALEAGQVEDAWMHIEAALAVAPTSVPALLLGARCQYGLGAFEASLDLLATARQHARDGDEVTLVVRLRDDCEVSLIEEVAHHAHGLMDHDRAAEAVELVKRKVARYPEVLGLHYVLGGVLLTARRLTEARDVVEAVLATDEADGVEILVELHRSILSELCAPQVELARQALRAKQPKVAIERLTACGEALYANPQYERLWSYAHARYAKRVPFAGWRRARRVNVKPLEAEDLQDILAWLLSEDIDAAMDAFRGSNFREASRYCARAEAIDSRSGTVAYLHAAAEKCAADAILNKIDLSTLAVAERHLATAARHAAMLTTDPVLADEGRALATRIAADRTEVARLTRLINCLSRFDALMKRYEHRSITTRNELYAVKSELRSIRAAAKASQREHESDSAIQQTLDNLLRAVETTLRHLPA